jgi:hypothetical protein
MEVRGSVANTTMGTAPAQGRWRVAVHGEAARRRRRRNSISASNHAPLRPDKGKIGAGLGWSPREKAQGYSDDGQGTAGSRVDGAGAAVV